MWSAQSVVLLLNKMFSSKNLSITSKRKPCGCCWQHQFEHYLLRKPAPSYQSYFLKGKRGKQFLETKAMLPCFQWWMMATYWQECLLLEKNRLYLQSNCFCCCYLVVIRTASYRTKLCFYDLFPPTLCKFNKHWKLENMLLFRSINRWLILVLK